MSKTPETSSTAKKRRTGTYALYRDVWETDPRDLLRVDSSFQLASLDHRATPGWSGDERDAAAYTEEITPLLATLQERLFAAANEGSARRVLVIAQGLDTAGKGGLARHVMGLVDPQGVRLTAFKAPTPEERSHDFLWRIRKAVPGPGYIGFFDRSQYEDVLVPGAAGSLDDDGFTWLTGQIRAFERELIDSGTTILKVALMVSYDEQGLRLLERVDRPDKHWKYQDSDMATRAKWFDYLSIYQRTLTATSFPEAPWYVIPADNKWYARLAVTEMLLRTLAEMEVPWPSAHFDVDTERDRVRTTISSGALIRYDAKIGSKLNKVASRIAAVDRAARSLSADEADEAPSAGTAQPASASRDSSNGAGKSPRNGEGAGNGKGAGNGSGKKGRKRNGKAPKKRA